MAVFEESSSRGLNEALATGSQRGGEYSDTWALDAQHPLFTAMARKITDGDDSREADRLVRAAGLVDTKISRIVNGGPFKRDSYIDLLNYAASLLDFHEAYVTKYCCASCNDNPEYRQVGSHSVETIRGEQHQIDAVQPGDTLAQKVGQLNGERCTV